MMRNTEHSSHLDLKDNSTINNYTELLKRNPTERRACVEIIGKKNDYNT